MKITLEEMWQSIDRILFPGLEPVITARECGYVIPEALKDAAVSMVRDNRFTENYYQNPHQRMFDEQNVIDGLREIKHNGLIEFTDTKGNT